MKNKLFVIWCTVLITASLFTACGTKNDSKNNNKNTVTDGMNEMGQDIKDMGDGMAETAKDAVENTGEAIDRGMNSMKDAVDPNNENNNR